MLLTYQPDNVYGWKQEIASILQVVTASEPTSHAIYGMRAIGKSTLLKFLKDPNGARVHYADYFGGQFARAGNSHLLWVYIDFHEFAQDDHIFYVMYENLYDELYAEDRLSQIRVDEPDRDLDKNKTARLLRRLLQDLKRSLHIRVVFMLDDFDIPLLSEQIDPNDDRLLRTVSNEAALIIATDEPITEIDPKIRKEDSPLLGILRPEPIGLISEQAARDLIWEPAARAGVEFEEPEVNMLLKVGGRQPFLLIATCEVYFDMRPELIEIEDAFAQPAMVQQLQEQLVNRLLVLPHVNNVLNLMWAKNAKYQDTLIEMSQMGCKGVNGTDAAALATRAMAFRDPQTHNYHIFSELFADFVRKQANITKNAQQAPEASLMLIINGLPPIDRAVFEQLAQHRGEVCTFEDLLQAVWVEGDGTKRALEAAVHRLRRAVPRGHEIKNVRGKGYKYISSV